MSAPCYRDCPITGADFLKLATDVGKLCGTVDGIAKQQDAMHKAMFGNGQAGHEQRIAALETEHAAEDGGKKAITDRRLMWASLIASIGVIVAIFYHVFTMSQAGLPHLAR